MQDNGICETTHSLDSDLPNTDEVDNGVILLRYYCGAGPCRPKHMQVFANAKFFTFLLCVFGLIEGALISGEHANLHFVNVHVHYIF